MCRKHNCLSEIRTGIVNIPETKTTTNNLTMQTSEQYSTPSLSKIQHQHFLANPYCRIHPQLKSRLLSAHLRKRY